MSLNIKFLMGECVGEEGEASKSERWTERYPGYYSSYSETYRMPTPIARGVNTTIMVKDGDTFAIGGIEYMQTSITEKKVPILGSIPLIGWLFKREIKTTSKKELIPLITPHIFEFGESPEREKEE